MHRLKIILKVFNPFIWLWNTFKYASHLDVQTRCEKYTPYDFTSDTKYF